ncbi:hypothetical protein P9139_02170 [Curtobacterium flaccumfaciens]|nr:hypothetical protein P9139_02170 [Curtobacterium flaccumfaciens]
MPIVDPRPGLIEVLGPDANLVRFARRFRLDPPGPDDATEGDESVAKFVLRESDRGPGPTDPGPTDPGPTDPGPTEPAPTEPGPTEPEPRPGRLAAAVRARWAAGGHWTVRTGTAPIQAHTPGTDGRKRRDWENRDNRDDKDARDKDKGQGQGRPRTGQNARTPGVASQP